MASFSSGQPLKRLNTASFSPAAIAKAKAKAHEVGADVDFVIDDLTRLTGVSGHFDVLVDYGTFDDLSNRDRAAYVDQVRALAKPGAKFLLWCFEWEPKGWERVAIAILPPRNITLRPGEVEQRRRDLRRLLGERIVPHDWTFVIVLAISSQVIGQGLLVYAIGALPPIVVGLTLLTQPAISALVGWIGYGETLQPLDWIGAFAIAAALVLVRLPVKGLKPIPEGTS